MRTWISCSVVVNSITSIQLESYKSHSPPVKPIVLVHIASSKGSRSTMSLALSPPTLVLEIMIMAVECNKTRSFTTFIKMGFKAPHQFHIRIYITTRIIRETKINKREWSHHLLLQPV